MRVLIVEDDEANKLVIKDLIEMIYDVDVVVTSNGLEALEMLEKEKFDIVLSDIKLPKMDGYEFIKEFKKRYSIPAVAITAFAVDGDREKILDAGFDDYVAKPVDFDELQQILDKYLDRR